MSNGVMERLIASLDRNSDLMEKLSGKTAAATGTKTTTAAAAKGDDAPAKPRGRPAKEKALTATEMSEKAREFAEEAQEDEAEFKERRALLTKLAKKFGADKFSNIKDLDDQKAALAALEEHVAGGDGGEGDEPDEY